MSIPPICQGILTLTTALVNPISYHLFCKCTPKNNISSHFHSLCYKQTFYQVCIFYPMLQTDLLPSIHFLYPVACVQLMRFRCAICIASPVYVSKNTPCYSPTLSIVAVTFFVSSNYSFFGLFRGNGGLKTATTLCLSRLSGIQLSVRKWNAYIRAYKVHHIKHILYVSEAISFTDNELNLVISCFNPGITHTIADCI